METGLAQAPSYQIITDIPREIYQPLLQIAQQGYSANDIKQWYLTIRSDLRRIDSENAEAAYSQITPTSNCFTTLQAPQVRLLNGEEAHSFGEAQSLQNSRLNSTTEMDPWSGLFPSDPFPGTHFRQSSTASTQSIYQSSEDGQQSTTTMSAQWSPSCSIEQEVDVSGQSTAATEAATFMGSVDYSSQWFSPGTFNISTDSPRDSHASSPPQLQMAMIDLIGDESLRSRPSSYSQPYQVPLSDTAMPLLVPWDSPRQPIGLQSNTIPTSLGIRFPSCSSSIYATTFPPPITVIPSRKRKKTLKKGVKKIIQPLQHHRQSI